MKEAVEEVDGSFNFAGTLVVYTTTGGDFHHAISKICYSSPSEVKLEHVTNDIPISASAYSPLFPSGFTRAPDPLPQICYIKKPSLRSYNRIRQGSQPNHIAEAVLLKATVCEHLRQHRTATLPVISAARCLRMGGLRVFALQSTAAP